MKRYLPILILVLFGLSACTLLFPAQNQLDVSVLEVGYEGDKLAVYLENADADYFITVNGIAYDCEADGDREGVVKCVGPAFEPGKKVTLRVYEDDQASKALGAIDFEVPEPEPDYADADGDGQPDAIDQCPDDPLKATPGICGCGTTEKDDDGDGTPNCVDAYPDDPDRTGEDAATPQPQKDEVKDSDDDGVPDDEDLCPEDPDKAEPGVCGCGIADVDSDEDGVMDCEDQCPEIAYADLIGDPCDKDEDDDGYVDGADQCPYDPLKYFAGACGCGNPDYDTDGDGTADCVDLCPKDKNKIEPGKCGCGTKDKDSDGDGKVDCKDPYVCPPSEFDSVGDPCNHDEDGDGTKDCDDGCPFDKMKIEPMICGCGVVEDYDDDDEDGVKNCLDKCPLVYGENPDGCP